MSNPAYWTHSGPGPMRKVAKTVPAALLDIRRVAKSCSKCRDCADATLVSCDEADAAFSTAMQALEAADALAENAAYWGSTDEAVKTCIVRYRTARQRLTDDAA